MSNRYRSGSGELAHHRADYRWKHRKTPMELGKYHAAIGRKRDDNPYSDAQPQGREDWFAGYDLASLRGPR